MPTHLHGTGSAPRLGRVNVLGPFSLSFAMNDGVDRLDAHAWHSLVLSCLARHEEGLIVCTSELEIVFSTSLGAELLARLGDTSSRTLPEAVGVFVLRQTSGRLTATDGRSIIVSVTMLRNVTPSCAALWLWEEP